MAPNPTLSDEQVRWRKSSYSEGGQQGQCVEVGAFPGRPDAGVFIRDTKDLAGGTLAVNASAWAGFVAMVKRDAST